MAMETVWHCGHRGMDVAKEVVTAKRIVVVMGRAGCMVVATGRLWWPLEGCSGHRETVVDMGRVGCRMVAIGRS